MADKITVVVLMQSGLQYHLEVTVDELSDLRNAIMKSVINPIDTSKKFREDSYFELPASSPEGLYIAFRASSIEALEFTEENL